MNPEGMDGRTFRMDEAAYCGNDGGTSSRNVAMKPILASLFPNASQATANRNPQLLLAKRKQNDSTGILKRRRGIPNKTEAEFALMLEAQKRKGEIVRYEFEGITLRWADMRYTPDFVVFEYDYNELPMYQGQQGRIKLIEVKGGHIWDRDIVRFKGARAYWPEFAFEMHQKTKQGWKHKY